MRDPRIQFGRLGNSLFQYSYIYAQQKRGEIPDWFVQSSEYFEEFSEEIKKFWGEGIGMLPYTAIHLRVGRNPLNPAEPAYKDNSFYTPLHKTRYYADAFAMFPQDRFLIFSDDIAYAREYFQGDRFGFDESVDEIEALNKMASCQNVITANSSFSWWAGFLCPHASKKIVTPKEDKWFSDGVVRTKVPKDWVQLDFPQVDVDLSK